MCVALIVPTSISFLDVLRRERVDIAMVSASALIKTKGVLIVVRRNLQFTNVGVGNDADGRMAFMKAVIGNKKIAFLSFYAPNSYDAIFYT